MAWPEHFRTISSAILVLFSVPGEIQHKFQILKLLLPKQNSAHSPGFGDLSLDDMGWNPKAKMKGIVMNLPWDTLDQCFGYMSLENLRILLLRLLRHRRSFARIQASSDLWH